MLFIGTRFSNNFYTAVDTPAEAAWCHSGWRVRPKDLAAPRDGPPNGAGDGRPYRDGGFGINAGKFSAAGANARARARTHSVNFAERWRG